MAGRGASYAVGRYSGTGHRLANEDGAEYEILEGSAVFTVTDGLGAHQGGDSAARVAVQRVVQRFCASASSERIDSLDSLARAAHEEVLLCQSATGLESMRTTLAVLVLEGTSARWGHIGDTRIYHFRGGRLSSRTLDHSVPQLLVQAGEIEPSEIRDHPDRNKLRQALGQPEAPVPSLSEVITLEDRDAFLLCTDGWWEPVGEEEMEASLVGVASPQEWLERMAALIDERADPAQDNYTAVGVWVGVG